MTIPIAAFDLMSNYIQICCYFEEYRKAKIAPEQELENILAKKVVVINETNEKKMDPIEGKEKVVQAFKEKIFDNTTDLKLFSTASHYLEDKEMISLTMKIREYKKDLGEVDVEENTLIAWKLSKGGYKIKGIYMNIKMTPVLEGGLRV